jgi:hypothetical protein
MMRALIERVKLVGMAVAALTFWFLALFVGYPAFFMLTGFVVWGSIFVLCLIFDAICNVLGILIV